jgi:hypothetical protein
MGNTSELTFLFSRREEGTPLLEDKFKRHITPWFSSSHVDK